MTGQAIRLGIIGCGIMGERIIRAALALEPGLVKLSALWDPDPAARDRLTAEFPDLPFVDHAPDVSGASDVVYIASPPATHLGHARIALGAGRAIFTEKPLGVSMEESQAFLEMVGQSGRAAAVNFVVASSPAVASLQAWLAEGVIGKPEQLVIRTEFAAWPRPWQMDADSWLSRRTEGGFTREVVSHFLFLTGRRLGQIELLDATAEFPPGDGAETGITVAMRAGDVPITLTGGVGATAKDDHNLWLPEGEAGAGRLSDWSTAERRGEGGPRRLAPGARPRLRARGAQPNLVTSARRAVLAQRLVRKTAPDNRGTYKGRLAAHERMTGTDTIRSLTAQQRVVVVASVQGVAARIALQCVVTCATNDEVIAITTAEQHVIATGTVNDVVECVTGDGIVKGAAQHVLNARAA